VKGARGVIINVTGGTDLSLIEVSEASAIIQEAAHEDANIIFGAVVDPALQNKVKITVIATGFDHVKTERSSPANAPMQTPVDLQAYQMPMRAEATPTIQPRATIVRRPSLELPLGETKVAVGQNTEAPGTAALPGEFDLNLDLDVPAFLRRSEG
jgi:cell division protein FtsZ